MPPESTPNLRETLGAYVRVLRESGRQSVRLGVDARRALAALSSPVKSVAATSTPSSAPVSAAPRVTRPVVAAAPAPRIEVVEERIEITGSTRIEKLASLNTRVASCRKCPHLADSRTQTVFGVGNPDAALMFVGEAPGADEDKQGEPFVGAAGQLLTKMIAAMGLSREQVYIANVLKCRPDMPKGSTGNRKPTPAEMKTCLPYLLAQIEIIQPKIMVALGATAMEGLFGPLQPGSGIGRLRGKFMEFQSTPVMPTFHPSYLLRNQSVTEKRKVWEDLLQVMDKLALPISEKQRGYFLSKG